MSRFKVTKEKRVVDADSVSEVLEKLIENEIHFDVTGADSEEDTITIEIEYGKEDRETLVEISDMTYEYEEDEDDED